MDIDAISLAKTLLGITNTSEDEKLLALEKIVESKIKSYCRLDSVSSSMGVVKAQMILVDYNRLGTEHLTQQTISNISESYIDSYPVGIVEQLNSFKDKSKKIFVY